MPASFHEDPFDEGTLTKLELFERYAEAWLPVFLVRDKILWPKVNIFDFFAGPGTDGLGVEGSPLRLLRVLKGQQHLLSRPGLHVSLYLSDDDAGKIEQLRQHLSDLRAAELPITIDVQCANFASRYAALRSKIASKDSANLLIIDQFGVKEVQDELFRELTSFETTDLLFFVSSGTFRRFEKVPEVSRLLIPGYERPGDYHRAHLAVADAYRKLIPSGRKYFVAPFSIKKGSNVYGVIFGSGHRLGMNKFLDVAWDQDKVSGEANFDVYREGIQREAPALFGEMNVPTKLKVFEEDLELEILANRCPNEVAVIEICHLHGVRPQHAEPVLKRLKSAKVIDCGFRVPDIGRLACPRPLKLL